MMGQVGVLLQDFPDVTGNDLFDILVYWIDGNAFIMLVIVMIVSIRDCMNRESEFNVFQLRTVQYS